MSQWLLGYRDPQGRGFLGGVIVEASGAEAAMRLVTDLGLDPGGEVAALEWKVPHLRVKDDWCNRALSADEVRCVSTKGTELCAGFQGRSSRLID